MQAELSTSLPMFLEDRDDINEEEGSTAHVSSSLFSLCVMDALLSLVSHTGPSPSHFGGITGCTYVKASYGQICVLMLQRVNFLINSGIQELHLTLESYLSFKGENFYT